MTDPLDPRPLLGALDVPPAPRDLTPRVLAASAPLLAAYARETTARAWLRPLVVALLPLPVVLAVDVTLVRALHALLALVLPDVVSIYLAGQYALVLLLLLTLTYAAVPLLAERQSRAALEDAHV